MQTPNEYGNFHSEVLVCEVLTDIFDIFAIYIVKRKSTSQIL